MIGGLEIIWNLGFEIWNIVVSVFICGNLRPDYFLIRIEQKL